MLKQRFALVCIAAGVLWAGMGAVGLAQPGIQGEYYSWTGSAPPEDPFQVLELERIDPGIDFRWNNDAPDALVPANNFAVRWVGDIIIPATETYRFFTISDDGVRLWVNGQVAVENWTDHGDTENVSPAMELQAGSRVSVEMWMYENGGGATAILMWESPSNAKGPIPASAFGAPLVARGPVPMTGAIDVTQAPVLSWMPGEGATGHHVYFGSNAGAVAGATPSDTAVYQGQFGADVLSFEPGNLDWNTTYYWRIDEITGTGVVTGPVWSFTTAQFIVVEDFEQYTNDEPLRIFDIWLDGWEDNTNGSIVGHEESPFAEQEIVHGGDQSMIFQYDNSEVARISEATRMFDQPIDLSGAGILEAMTVWYQGRRGPADAVQVDPATGVHTLSGAGAGIYEHHDELQFAYTQLTGDGTIVARIDSMDNTGSSALAGVMIRETLDPDAVQATVGVTPRNRAVFAFRGTAGLNTAVTSTNSDSFSLPHWVRLVRTGNLIKAEHSDDGVTWMPVESADPEAPSEYDFFGMQSSIYVGLAVTAANNSGNVCTATFSDVTVTGGGAAAPLTESIEIGLVNNGPERLYLGLVDASGNTSIQYNEDGTQAVLADDWTLWSIALSDFANDGVNMTAISEMILGAGDRGNPQIGGAGTLYFDDIQVVRRMPIPDKLLLLSEDFEGLALGANVDESLAGDAVWTNVPPTDWTRDNSGVPAAGDPDHGVDEWEGWTFADQKWWAEAAGDQRRTEFALALGTVAVADSDEYDDKGDPQGSYNAFLNTPVIDVSGVEAGAEALVLRFDSSWRPESSQTATITASFDNGDPIEVLRWESNSGSPLYHDHMTSELVTVPFERPAGAKDLVLTFGYFDASNNWWWAIDNVEVMGAPRARAVALAEDFEGLDLGPNVEEGGAGSVPEAFTHTPPAGWFVDRSGVPGYGDPDVDGVSEWAGWSFADKEFWVNTDRQRREEFDLGQGIVAVADSDEWDDSTHPPGYHPSIDAYDTYMTTPTVDISEFEPGSVQLKFDSSWRPEFDDNYHQSANITVSFDGGDPIEVLRWESDGSSPYYKDDNSTNEIIVVELDNPGGAQQMEVTFGMFEAGNDWWWAIDNIEITGILKEKIPVFTEDFEGLPLGPNVDESLAGAEVWTKQAPEGWTIDDSGVPGAGTDNDGVTEWAGWSFADKAWWVDAAGDQQRSQFSLGEGTVALVDPDEWDDLARADGLLNSFLSTPPIDISSLAPGTIELLFDSSWRREDTQTATVSVSFDGGPATEILRWESEGADTGYLKDDATNERVSGMILSPPGAKTMVITFGMLDAGNDWWWAIDNIVVQGFAKAKDARLFLETFDGLVLQESVEEEPPVNAFDPERVWTAQGPEGWIVDDSGVPGAGTAEDGVSEWAGWAFADKNWWPTVDNQRRSEFELAEGTIAIADSDEYDDQPHPAGTYNTWLTTPIIDVAAAGDTLELTFASSWRPEGGQAANITASFDGGDPVEIMLWSSDPGSADYHDHMTSEMVTVSFAKPAGAQNVALAFGYFDASNNWWWAIDNVKLAAGGAELFFEDFEGLALEPPIDEVAVLPAGARVWTPEPPAGWVNDASAVPGAGDPANDGVTEWAGWSFAQKDWWVDVAGDQERSQFVLGERVVAIADPDEWDDAGHPDGFFNAFLSTPAIDISNVEAGSLKLLFDSSWRQEDTQTATVTVAYDGGEPQVVLLWESAGGDPAFFKADATSEKVSLRLDNPEGAQTVTVTFGVIDAGNDWWWAIDNVELVGSLVE